MTERLIEKIDRLGAAAGIETMTPEIRRFAMLVREDVVAQPARQHVSVTDELVDDYCKAWEQSFTAYNPYHTVSMTAGDRKHIEAGLNAALAKQPAQQPVVLRETLAAALTCTYVCGRVWSAWGVGTMSQDDFTPASECDELLDALVSAVTTAAPQPAQPLPFGVGGGLVAIKTLLSRDPCGHANTAIQMIDAILAEQPAQQEPNGIEFLMRGDKMTFKIGVQQFTLDYEPVEPGEFEFMRDMLLKALSAFTPDVNTGEPAPVQQEPAAWRVKWPSIGGGYRWLMVDRPLLEKEGFENEALYTSPQPAQQEPVTWLEILRNNKTATDEVIGAFLRGHAEHLTGETFVLSTPDTPQPAQRNKD